MVKEEARKGTKGQTLKDLQDLVSNTTGKALIPLSGKSAWAAASLKCLHTNTCSIMNVWEQGNHRGVQVYANLIRITDMWRDSAQLKCCKGWTRAFGKHKRARRVRPMGTDGAQPWEGWSANWVFTGWEQRTDQYEWWCGFLLQTIWLGRWSGPFSCHMLCNVSCLS